MNFYYEHDAVSGEAIDLGAVRKAAGTIRKEDRGWASSEEMPCVFCNRPVRTRTTSKTYVRCHFGTTEVCVSDAELERLNSSEHAGGDMGCYPIGSDCLRKVCKLVPGFREKFVVTLEGE